MLFPTILASTVHDIKNSLGIVLELIRQLANKQPSNETEDLLQLQFEANRINHSLMQLLVIYKIDSSKFAIQIDEYAAADIINEAKAQQDSLSRLHSVKLLIDCDENLLCFCDFANISNALGTVLNNAMRYTNSSIQISVSQQDDFIIFCIEDDGQGYPEHLLHADFTGIADLDWVKGNTGLGLFFVSIIASLHTNNGKCGFVKIDNQSRLGGARFSLYLP